MTRDDDPALPQVHDYAPGRPAGTWAKLLIVFAAGLVSWIIWLLAFGYVLFNVL